ncbi:MAG: cupin domain-containing protein [Rhodospirillales bacterium]|nr:cupin domain-containing protein [Rhodospirillales bacterium]
MSMEIRRVVTGHDEDGKAVVTQDGTPPRLTTSRAGSELALFWVEPTTPANNSDPEDGGDMDIGIPPPPGGSIFRVVEFPPEQSDEAASAPGSEGLSNMGAETPDGARHPGMHRTDSIDYAIIMTGEIDMLLDDSEVHLKAGDVVVQRGTYHAWANRGSVPCRVAFVLIDADPAR